MCQCAAVDDIKHIRVQTSIFKGDCLRNRHRRRGGGVEGGGFVAIFRAAGILVGLGNSWSWWVGFWPLKFYLRDLRCERENLFVLPGVEHRTSHLPPCSVILLLGYAESFWNRDCRRPSQFRWISRAAALICREKRFSPKGLMCCRTWASSHAWAFWSTCRGDVTAGSLFYLTNIVSDVPLPGANLVWI